MYAPDLACSRRQQHQLADLFASGCPVPRRPRGHLGAYQNIIDAYRAPDTDVRWLVEAEINTLTSQRVPEGLMTRDSAPPWTRDIMNPSNNTVRSCLM